MRMKALLGRAGVVVLVAAIGALTNGDANPPPDKALAPNARPATTVASRCLDVSPAVVAAIAAGLTVSGGGSLHDAQAVKSADFEKVYFVSAEISGSGLERAGDVGTWTTNDIAAVGGLFYSVDGIAREFSDWGDGAKTDAAFSLDDDGARESRECVAP